MVLHVIQVTLAIKKVYELKNRPKFNPLIIHVNSIQQGENFIC